MTGRSALRAVGWPALHVFSVSGFVAFPYLLLVVPQMAGYDTWAYAHVDLADPYGSYGNLAEFGAFRYPPPAAFAFAALDVVPWPAFLWIWLGILVAAVAYLGRQRYTLALLGFPIVARELHFGNVNLVLAAVVAVGFRFPALWSVVLLTKPTCGIALVWFAVRREWRPLAIALGVTAAISLPTVILRPDLWAGWIALVADNAGVPQWLPIAVRLPVAALVAASGGLTGRRWTVPVAATIAVPNLWWNHLAVVVGALPFLASDRSLPPWIRVPRRVSV